ncbi:MAG: hypothetical protein IPM39_16575 [Chloroflexi bacterium]|nr:hypothetical protein [Chloroflexota bacterium]
MAEVADGGQLPEEMNIPDEIARRQQQLARLAEAKKVLEERAQARYEAGKPNTRPRCKPGPKRPTHREKAAGQTTAATHSRTQR